LIISILSWVFELPFNGERGHQSLGHQTLDIVYATGQRVGAKIIDKFGRPFALGGHIATGGQIHLQRFRAAEFLLDMKP